MSDLGPSPQPNPPQPTAAPPNWYPSGHGMLRWWDGQQWTAHEMQDASSRNLAKGMTVAVIGLLIIGVFLNLQDVNLLTGADKVWVGAGLCVLAAVLTWIPKQLNMWLMIVAAIVAILTVANAVYVEYQLQQKADDLFNSSAFWS